MRAPRYSGIWLGAGQPRRERQGLAKRERRQIRARGVHGRAVVIRPGEGVGTLREKDGRKQEENHWATDR